MRRYIDRAAQKLERSARLLEYRRLNWRVETNHRIRWEFEAFARTTRDLGLPFAFRVQQHDTPNEGQLQLTALRSLTGVVDRKHDFSPEGFRFSDTPIEETGGELVASQSATGFVHFIAHPRTSDRLRATKTELIIAGPLDPTEVTVSRIRKALRHYLLVLQDSSIIGAEDALTRQEKLVVLWLYFRELRNRHDLYRSLLSMKNEWAKLLVAAVLAFLAGYITASKA
jgi:hypothetical protein